MKVIIAGSRGIPKTVFDSILPSVLKESQLIITEVISGTAKGVDTFGEEWAEKNNIPVKKFKADWSRFGKAAGFYRNADMGEYADAAIILWDMESKGTQHMINCMKRLNKPCFVEYVEC